MKYVLADPGKGVTLETFIKRNEQLLSALGAFSALTVLSQNLASSLFRYGLSFIFFIGTILIWFELYFKLPKEQSLRLFLFQYILLWGGAGIAAYCIYEFRFISNLILFFPTTLLIFGWSLGTLLPIIRRIPLTRKLFGIDNPKKTKIQIFIRSCSVIFLLVNSLFFGLYLSLGINLFFEILSRLNA